MSDIDTDPPATKPEARKAPARKRKPAVAGKAAKKGKAADVPSKRTSTDHAGNAAPAETGEPPIDLIRVPLSVRWRDLDAFNHVNNSTFLSYLEEARLRWMLSVPGQGLEDHVAPVVVASNLNYRRPIEWPNEIAVELFVERLGNTSVSIGHRIVDANDTDVLYCDGNVVMVWIDRGTGAAAPLPQAVRESCSAR